MMFCEPGLQTYQTDEKDYNQASEAAQHGTDQHPVRHNHDITGDSNAILNDNSGRGWEEGAIFSTLSSLCHNTDKLKKKQQNKILQGIDISNVNTQFI